MTIYGLLQTVLAFLVALGVLIAIHEYGHYRVAVACGIKVLKFSIGFGPPIYTWRLKGKPTEFAIGMLPLGGYVKMLDEREAPVDAAERHLAFNTQPLRSRAAVVAAGPIANLLLAILLYTLVNWGGVQEPKAILSSPVPGSIADKAGLQGGEQVSRAGFTDETARTMRSFEDLRWLLTRGALDGRDIKLVTGEGDASREFVLKLSALDAGKADAELFRKVGIVGPWTQPVINEVRAGGAGDKAGLRRGDLVQRIDDKAIVDGMQLYETIRDSVTTRGGAPAEVTAMWQVLRDGKTVNMPVTPALVMDDKRAIGRIGAGVSAPPAMLTVRYGVFEGLWQGTVKTWEVSLLTLRMMGKMVVGQASLKNLSGPLTIAEYAGKSASMGLSFYLVYLALISVSLGVLNLLPLPVLDGGHLMYYLWEWITGRGVSDAWMERLQRGGVAILLGMMCIALFNDVSRHIG